MKEFSELIQMVYATYSNSSPIARNLKIKNWKSKIVPLGWRFCDPWVGVLAARGWHLGGPGLAFRRPGVGVSATRSNWLNYYGQSKRVAETSTPMSRNRQPPCRGIANPHVARTSTQGHYFLFFLVSFLQFSRCRGRVGINGIYHSNKLNKLFHINLTCIFSEPSL